MTVREAFKAAGYPVPEDARIIRRFDPDEELDYWAWRTDSKYSDRHSSLAAGVSQVPGMGCTPRGLGYGVRA